MRVRPLGHRHALLLLATMTFALGALACAPNEDAADPELPHSVVKPPPPDVPGPAPLTTSADACSDTDEGFDAWLDAFLQSAVAQGTPRALASYVRANVTYDPSVIDLDRTQRPHAVSAEKFAATHVTPARVRQGKRLLSEYADLLGRIEARFGVPPEILVSLWGLETDFGSYQGTTRSLDALATLAYDCRRAARFRDELRSALRILQRGDLTAEQMKGAWAGELGQTQFLPSSYEHFGIDFDGDHRIDLIDSVDDALASTANYLAGHGWRAHEGYAQGSANATALASWNESPVYRSAVALFAEKLATKRH